MGLKWWKSCKQHLKLDQVLSPISHHFARIERADKWIVSTAPSRATVLLPNHLQHAGCRKHVKKKKWLMLIFHDLSWFPRHRSTMIFCWIQWLPAALPPLPAVSFFATYLVRVKHCVRWGLHLIRILFWITISLLRSCCPSYLIQFEFSRLVPWCLKLTQSQLVRCANIKSNPHGTNACPLSIRSGTFVYSPAVRKL